MCVSTGDYLTRYYDEVASRLKVLAAMDIAEHRLPQDGSFAFRCVDGEVDVRASVVPVADGEKIALRFFARDTNSFEIERLGLSNEQLEIVRCATSGHRGMVLVAGPTGSGKTTTLYALLRRVNKVGINILTAEDPIERRLEGVNQCEVRREINLDFSQLLRAFLRQDPEVIMIGEIRDTETADIAVKAALTGHLVLSTVHSGNAVEALQRLAQLGVNSELATAAVRVVIAQRLFRQVCAKCGIPDEDWQDENGQALMRGSGCEACMQTGYRGRIGIFELLEMRAESESALSLKSLQPKATLVEAATDKVRQGHVSVAEFQRVMGCLPEGITLRADKVS